MRQQWTGCLSLLEAHGHPGPAQALPASLPGPRGTRGRCCGACRLWAVEVSNFMQWVTTEGSSTEGASPKGLLSQLHGPHHRCSRYAWGCHSQRLGLRAVPRGGQPVRRLVPCPSF